MVDFAEIIPLIKDSEVQKHAKDLQEDAMKRLMNSMRDYVDGRMKAVIKEAETPAFAALLVEKYALGLMAAAGIVGFGLNTGPLQDFINQSIYEIDPHFRKNTQARYQARPASIGGIEETKLPYSPLLRKYLDK